MATPIIDSLKIDDTLYDFSLPPDANVTIDMLTLRNAPVDYTYPDCYYTSPLFSDGVKKWDILWVWGDEQQQGEPFEGREGFNCCWEYGIPKIHEIADEKYEDISAWTFPGLNKFNFMYCIPSSKTSDTTINALELNDIIENEFDATAQILVDYPTQFVNLAQTCHGVYKIHVETEAAGDDETSRTLSVSVLGTAVDNSFIVNGKGDLFVKFDKMGNYIKFATYCPNNSSYSNIVQSTWQKAPDQYLVSFRVYNEKPIAEKTYISGRIDW